MTSLELAQNLNVLADRPGEPIDVDSLVLDERLRIGPYFRLLRDSSEDTICELVESRTLRKRTSILVVSRWVLAAGF
jgi:hypothetical protein